MNLRDMNLSQMKNKFASIKNAQKNGFMHFASTQYPIIKCHDASVALKYYACCSVVLGWWHSYNHGQRMV